MTAAVSTRSGRCTSDGAVGDVDAERPDGRQHAAVGAGPDVVAVAGGGADRERGRQVADTATATTRDVRAGSDVAGPPTLDRQDRRVGRPESRRRGARPSPRHADDVRRGIDVDADTAVEDRLADAVAGQLPARDRRVDGVHDAGIDSRRRCDRRRLHVDRCERRPSTPVTRHGATMARRTGCVDRRSARRRSVELVHGGHARRAGAMPAPACSTRCRLGRAAYAAPVVGRRCRARPPWPPCRRRPAVPAAMTVDRRVRRRDVRCTISLPCHDRDRFAFLSHGDRCRYHRTSTVPAYGPVSAATQSPALDAVQAVDVAGTCGSASLLGADAATPRRQAARPRAAIAVTCGQPLRRRAAPPGRRQLWCRRRSRRRPVARRAASDAIRTPGQWWSATRSSSSTVPSSAGLDAVGDESGSIADGRRRHAAVTGARPRSASRRAPRTTDRVGVQSAMGPIAADPGRIECSRSRGRAPE